MWAQKFPAEPVPAQFPLASTLMVCLVALLYRFDGFIHIVSLSESQASQPEVKIKLPSYYNNNEEVRKKNATKERSSFFDDTHTTGEPMRTEYYESKRKVALW